MKSLCQPPHLGIIAGQNLGYDCPNYDLLQGPAFL
jgi:hypothetical protein